MTVCAPICGERWLDKHRDDHTQAEIDSLKIEIRIDDNNHITANNRTRRAIKDFVKLQRIKGVGIDKSNGTYRRTSTTGEKPSKKTAEARQGKPHQGSRHGPHGTRPERHRRP